MELPPSEAEVGEGLLGIRASQKRRLPGFGLTRDTTRPQGCPHLGPALTEHLLAPLRVRLVRVDPLEVAAARAVAHGGAGSAALRARLLRRARLRGTCRPAPREDQFRARGRGRDGGGASGRGLERLGQQAGRGLRGGALGGTRSPWASRGRGLRAGPGRLGHQEGRGLGRGGLSAPQFPRVGKWAVRATPGESPDPRTPGCAGTPGPIAAGRLFSRRPRATRAPAAPAPTDPRVRSVPLRPAARPGAGVGG